MDAMQVLAVFQDSGDIYMCNAYAGLARTTAVIGTSVTIAPC